MMPVTVSFEQDPTEKVKLTLDISDALLEDLLENLGVLKLLVDLAHDSLGELLLLALADLAFVTNPRVKNLLGLGSESGALLQLIGLGFELGGFLELSVNSF